jgi:hypothetical protein
MIVDEKRHAPRQGQSIGPAARLRKPVQIRVKASNIEPYCLWAAVKRRELERETFGLSDPLSEFNSATTERDDPSSIVKDHVAGEESFVVCRLSPRVICWWFVIESNSNLVRVARPSV